MSLRDCFTFMALLLLASVATAFDNESRPEDPVTVEQEMGVSEEAQELKKAPEQKVELESAYDKAFAAQFEPEKVDDPRTQCLSTREFVTVLEFLRARESQLGLSERESQQVAHKVSQGCTGSAARFARVLDILLKAELTARNSVQLATDLAKKTEAHAETFVMVFRQVFLPQFLDLDLKNSIKIAKGLAVDYEGDVIQARQEFDKLVKYCTDGRELGFPRPHCAIFAKRVAMAGQNYKKSVAEQFIKGVEFLGSIDGPELSSGQAFTLSASLVEISPYAIDNFMDAYRYGTSSAGLKLGSKDSLRFAKQMAQRTVAGEFQNEYFQSRLGAKRLPSSTKKALETGP